MSSSGGGVFTVVASVSFAGAGSVDCANTDSGETKRAKLIIVARFVAFIPKVLHDFLLTVKATPIGVNNFRQIG